MSVQTYYHDDNVTLLTGDASEALRRLPSGHADCIVTSPPYFRLRDYGVEGQIGLEENLADYLARLSEVFTEALRVLSDHGTQWLNLGDSYVCGPAGTRVSSRLDGRSNAVTTPAGFGRKQHAGLPDKSLIGIPWLAAFTLQNTGLWLLRSEIIWHKPNAMPESVRDRPSRKHETVFLFSKAGSGGRYHFDLDAIRQPPKTKRSPRHGRTVGRRDAKYRQDEPFPRPHGDALKPGRPHDTVHAKGVNPGDVWSASAEDVEEQSSVWRIATNPYHRAHFATFPRELVRRAVAAGCPLGGRVLDCFSGAATTGLAALDLGCSYTGIELNPEYQHLAAERLGLDVGSEDR